MADHRQPRRFVFIQRVTQIGQGMCTLLHGYLHNTLEDINDFLSLVVPIHIQKFTETFHFNQMIETNISTHGLYTAF